jgi:acyl-CoA synthetase (AMP-forming)/AMP-acid ligase II
MDSIAEQLPDIFNVAAYFLESNLAQERSDKAVFYHQGNIYTYAQVDRLVRRTARLLSELGLERENRMAILLPDTPEFVFAFWGAIWLGAVPVPINTASTLDDIQYILQDSRAKILLTTQEWQEKLTPISSQFLRRVLLIDGENPFTSLLTQQDEQLPHAETHATNPRSGFTPLAVRDALKVQFTSIAAWWFVQNTMLKPHLACAAMTSPTRLPRYPLHTAWGIRFICQWQLVPPLFYPMLAML